jgi:hypothetical protein
VQICEAVVEFRQMGGVVVGEKRCACEGHDLIVVMCDSATLACTYVYRSTLSVAS